ncbi:MAG TPA: DUF1176 domain-containing protein [Allosphingosinicella sp.]|nr:DUF1176 domain-containing protein [Allosphingosinicella sp.]
MNLFPILVAGAAAASPAPKPEDLRVYDDWTVGCDNGRGCQAVGLVPENWPDDAATIVIARGPEAGAAPEVSIAMREGMGTALEVDGKRLPLRLAAGKGEAKVAAADVPALIAAIRSGNELKVVGADGAAVGTASLKGASAALLYMDDRQQRVGTVTALDRSGARPASSVPPPPKLPVVRAVPLTRAAPIAVGSARIKALRTKHGCTIDEVGGPDSAEVYALSANQSLVLLACGSGAYNVSHVPFVATRRGRAITIALAPFDVKPDWWDNGLPILVNADWDPAGGLLGSFSKGRGLGDCGTTSSYAWDGSRFRLVEEATMGECRGSIDYITVWRARVVR